MVSEACGSGDVYALLAMLLVQPNLDDLGHEKYARREWAELRLKNLGPLAWPALRAAGASDNPEVRERVHRLLAPCRAFAGNLRAAVVLAGPWPPGSLEFWRDPQLRVRVYDLAIRAGCDRWRVYTIHPDKMDRWGFTEAVAAGLCWEAVVGCRKHLGFADDGWLFERSPAPPSYEEP
jgi:hypothetical protein